ncbi:hypothetical protein K2O51_23250 [Cupriavidus pinatubonensis]|uniref:hypothetical protein n=1 Tax=Cupriavidus pinatubonensis TaxID=248026 RepID=UPI001C7377AF|nr:hypothetical protein [Cupriavidus pinatubonensis]QYY30289.1 hypothetical protein K2O51_23250 [Cupriavidus pinatubonensis]
MLKRRLVRTLVDWLGEWNNEVHEAIEAKVFAEHRRVYPDGDDNVAKTIEVMRTFYYNRMATTANVMIGAVAVLVALVSLVVSVIALVK